MIDVSKVAYNVYAVLQDGTRLNVTPAVMDLGWEEGESELSSRFSFTVANVDYNGSPLSSTIKPNTAIVVTASAGGDEQEVASGKVIEWNPQDGAVFQDVQTCVKWMYERMAYGDEQYPGFFTLHSLGFMQEDKADGKRHMQQIWHHILNGLCTVLQQDTKIRPGAFNEQFTVEKFADVLFSLMLSALLRQDYDPAAVLEIVRRTLY